MSLIFERRIKKRTIILSIFFSLWTIGLILRLIQLQIFQHARLKQEVIEHNQRIDKILPKRGTIYDRNGIILVRSIPYPSIFFTSFGEDVKKLSGKELNLIDRILDLDTHDLKRIKKQISNNDSFIWIERKVDPKMADQISALKLEGIHNLEENKRFYPQGKLAAHVLGTVNIDNQGVCGIERSCNEILEGKIGKRLILSDAKRRKYRLEIIQKPVAGRNIVLTLDETIQYITEKELEHAMLKTKAKWGTVIVSHPSNGEILAMANYPTRNPNLLPPSSLDLNRNQAIHFLFEPGSTFKIVTASAAIESRKIGLNEIFDCSRGAISLDKITYHDHSSFEKLSFPEVIIHSSNVGTIQVGQRLGEELISETIHNFRFGKQTGIQLPAEEKGKIRPIEQWSKYSVSSLSIGYEISTTALQMLQALNVIANKGVYYPPNIIKSIEGSSPKTSTTSPKRIISEETARILTGILEEAVEQGTGILSRIDDYKIAGKTGTAQKFDPELNTYSSQVHTSSFMGFVPSQDPVLSIIVVIDDPQGEFYGGTVAAPVFREIAREALRYLNIPGRRIMPERVITAKIQSQESS
ncbi:MAG: penicillin-binding protein 2 [Candidatus Aminicenantes bacterium]|nr:penicillin-binding protein 2 [Candidatus Aminicenantes bacterium]